MTKRIEEILTRQEDTVVELRKGDEFGPLPLSGTAGALLVGFDAG